jgi:hypothetical protein
MLVSRIRAAMFALLAMMLVGFVMASSVLAAAGPFWHHRPIGGEGAGSKIEPSAPENLTGKQTEQTLLGEVSGIKIEVAAPGATVTDAIFNGVNSGQIKTTITYKEPKLKKPELKECGVVIGTNNSIVVKGHLVWKWSGKPEQLRDEPNQDEQTPDLVYTVPEPQQQSTTVVDYRKNGIFTTIAFKGTGCGVLAGTFSVEGSESGVTNKKIEEFSRTLAVRTSPSATSINKEAGEGAGFLQHYWAVKEFQGLIVGLKFGGNPASLIGQTEVEAAQQEVAIFEK